MKANEECYPCLERLINKTIDLASHDLTLREKARIKSLKILRDNFSRNAICPIISYKFHRIIKETTRNFDPFEKWKDEEIKIFKGLYKKKWINKHNNFKMSAKLSALGNGIDFFKDLKQIVHEIKEKIEFEIDDTDKFEKKISNASKILYLADNAGEAIFDLPLISILSKKLEVIYAVKHKPVQNDATKNDLKKAGILENFRKVITTGNDCVGVDFSTSSREFKKEFKNSDVIVSKGMGNYETLSEHDYNGKIFYILKAKCNPVAKDIGVPQESYIFACESTIKALKKKETR
jgi:uncharacterized protein with ATP-grasp and redox domains